MININIIWLCGFDIRKCINDIKEIKSFRNLYKSKIKINFIILDRRKQFKKKIIEEDLTSYKIFHSSLEKSHQSDYLNVLSKYKSDYIISISDDDKLLPKQFCRYLLKIPDHLDSKVIISVPKENHLLIKNYGKLKPNKKYKYWQYQKMRGPNLAYYSAISSESIYIACKKFIKHENLLWRHPMHDQCFIWSVLNNGKDSILSVDGEYLLYDNSNWQNKKSSKNTIKNFNLENKTTESLALFDIFRIYSKRRFNLEVLRWIFYLLKRSIFFYKNPLMTIKNIYLFINIFGLN